MVHKLQSEISVPKREAVTENEDQLVRGTLNKFSRIFRVHLSRGMLFLPKITKLHSHSP